MLCLLLSPFYVTYPVRIIVCCLVVRLLSIPMNMPYKAVKEAKKPHTTPGKLAMTIGQSFFLRMKPYPTHSTQLMPATIG